MDAEAAQEKRRDRVSRINCARDGLRRKRRGCSDDDGARPTKPRGPASLPEWRGSQCGSRTEAFTMGDQFLGLARAESTDVCGTIRDRKGKGQARAPKAK